MLSIGMHSDQILKLYANQLHDILKIAIHLLINYSSLVVGKCNQWKVKLRLIRLTCQIYAIAVIPMISMLVKISLQGTCNIFTVAYADDSTAAGLIDQLTKW